MPYRIHIPQEAGAHLDDLPPTILAKARSELEAIAEAADHSPTPRTETVLRRDEKAQFFLQGYWVEYHIDDAKHILMLDALGPVFSGRVGRRVH